MVRDPRRIAPALFASLVVLIAADAAARAEPAQPESSAGTECLAKPDADAAPGNHWYYHIDRASGRRCWYQRAVDAAQTDAVQNDAGQSRPRARSIAPPAADSPASERSADTPVEPRDRSAVAPATIAPAQPYSWSTAAPPVMPREPMTAPASDSVSPAPGPAISPTTETAIAPAPAAPLSRARAAVPSVERAAAAEDDSHVPALLGAALALVVIVLGSIALRLAAKLIRSRRRAGALLAEPPAPPPIYRADDAPALVPVMPREDDAIRETRAARAPGAAPASRRAGTPVDDAHMSDRARALEENVRELLRRLRDDLQAPGSRSAPAPSAEELDRALAMWRGQRRRRSAG